MDEAVDALVDVAPDGVDFDGLRVASDEDGFRLAVGEDLRAGLSETDLADAARDHPERVANWYFWHARAPQAAHRYAFLRWVEHAGEMDPAARLRALEDGRLGRTWGQVRISVTARGDGVREYELRHVDDVGADPADLAAHTDPGDARALAKFDERGNYRPVKGAPTLQAGWRFAGLDAGEAVDAVHFLYPATVANWHREREGDLDVDHWVPTTERQTGIYGLVQTWNRGEGHEHVEWVAEACCTDDQCLKRREWAYDEETDLAVDGGDGTFPCREPCSMVISAARTWTKREAEDERTYEVTLTESELEQLGATVSAVADDEGVRAGDVKHPANQYRARFLRAKRFEDGTLPAEVRDSADEGDGGGE